MKKNTPQRKRVLVACEWSGTVRDALRKKGIDAWSCDLEISECKSLPSYHYREDVRNLLDGDWDALIAFPPCTHLCVSGARWWKDKKKEQKAAIKFFMELWNAPIPLKAIENPVGIMSTEFRKPDQIIQPWQFGHEETKATCLWLDGFPKLKPTNVVWWREAVVHHMAPSPDRAKKRGRTYQGIADAIAAQWF